MEKPALKINHPDGSIQIINVSDKFDGDYFKLAHDIAKVAKPDYTILRDDDKIRRR